MERQKRCHWWSLCRRLGKSLQTLEFGRLGPLNLRWLWSKKTQPDRPWTEFNIHAHPNVEALFIAYMSSTVGDGTTTMFWTDRSVIAPSLVNRISSRIMKVRTVQES